MTKVTQIDLDRLARESRTQKIIFEAARDGLDIVGYDEEGPASQLLTRINWEDLINPTGMGTSSLPHANLERE